MSRTGPRSGGGPMAGRTVLVTGATSGIGLETARGLAALGARVLIGARDEERGRQAAAEVARSADADADADADASTVEFLPIDLASFASIRAAASRLAGEGTAPDVLVNNAGVAIRGRMLSADGHELTWATNFLGPFLLTRLLLPGLRAAPGPRVVNVSSEGHRVGRIDWDNLELERGYGTFRAYANSKLALNLFTRELARREPGIAVNALHPGAIATRIWRNAPAPLRALLGIVLPSSEKGARPVIRLAAAPELEGITGRYFDRYRETLPSERSRDEALAVRLWETAEAIQE